MASLYVKGEYFVPALRYGCTGGLHLRKAERRTVVELRKPAGQAWTTMSVAAFVALISNPRVKLVMGLKGRSFETSP